MGIIRSFLPLPSRIITVPRSASMSYTFRSTTSIRLMPVLYSVSRIALSRMPSMVVRSGNSMTSSTSLSLRMCLGRRRSCRGISISLAGL